MILKQFALTTPSTNPQRRNFELQTRSVSSMYERCFPKYHTNGIWKLLVDCLPNPNMPTTFVDMSIAGGVLSVHVDANIDQFWSLSTRDKKVQVAHWLQSGVQKAVHQLRWDEKPFRETFTQLAHQNYCNVWQWKATSSPNRTVSARVIVEHDVEQLTIFLDLFDRSNRRLKREVAAISAPDEWLYAPLLGKLMWRGNTVLLLDKAGNTVYTTTIEQIAPPQSD